MPYGNLTLQGVTFNPIDDGIYTKADVVFGDPVDELRVNGATSNKGGKTYSGSLTATMQKDVTAASGAITRKELRVVVMPMLTADFSAAELQVAFARLNDFIQTVGFSDRFLKGES